MRDINVKKVQGAELAWALQVKKMGMYFRAAELYASGIKIFFLNVFKVNGEYLREIVGGRGGHHQHKLQQFKMRLDAFSSCGR